MERGFEKQRVTVDFSQKNEKPPSAPKIPTPLFLRKVRLKIRISSPVRCLGLQALVIYLRLALIWPHVTLSLLAEGLTSSPVASMLF